MNKVDIKASTIEVEIAKGTKMEDIAKNLGISPNLLRKACKNFGINLRNKPRTSVNFIDDRKVEDVKTETVDNTTDLTEPVKETFTESLLKKPKKEKKEEVKVEEVVEVKVEEPGYLEKPSNNSETNDLDIEL